MRQEIDFLARELAAAAGLGGRNRKAGSYAERARVNVTRAIGATLRRIRTADASLARHLALRIKTGNFCVYRPEA
ncbi:MAG TPA: hypothetical protein VN812_05335 [Candidatus Acidoferrales bacterium]|nr:hypothetical protein [Candidatus Acidoferrales bacterium]